MSKDESQEQAQEMDTGMDAGMDAGVDAAATPEAETIPALQQIDPDEASAFHPGESSQTAAERPQGDPQRAPGDVTINPASFADLRPQSNGRKEKASLDMLLDIGLQVTVELGRAKMNIREVLTVGPGTVVELNRVAGEPVDILINGKPIAKGEVVVIGDMFGVRVTDILPPAQRVQSMI